MKVKLEAGASLDLLTREEVAQELRSWHAEVRAGVRYPLFTAQAAADPATGLFTITGDQLGPTEGFIWDVRRIAISSPADDISDARVFVNDPSPARFVCELFDDRSFNTAELVLNYGSQLVITGDTALLGQIVTVSGQAKEVPYLLGWSL